MQKPPITKSEPDETGHWSQFGGRYVPETLVAPLDELTNEFLRAREDPNFWGELNQLLRDYCGRPTPLCSDCVVSSIWVQKMCGGRHSTCSECDCSAPKSSLLIPERAS